jgi:hypothetical protein
MDLYIHSPLRLHSVLFNYLSRGSPLRLLCADNSRVKLANSHRVPPQVAVRGMLNAYIDGGYRGNKILGADQNRRCSENYRG